MYLLLQTRKITALPSKNLLTRNIFLRFKKSLLGKYVCLIFFSLNTTKRQTYIKGQIKSHEHVLHIRYSHFTTFTMYTGKRIKGM